MRKTWAVAQKELRQAFRDPLSLGMLIALPTFILLLYGYALNFDVKHVALAVQDRDKSPASRDLVASFVNTPYFDLTADLDAGADLTRLTEGRRAKAILVIPEKFSRELSAGRTADVQMILDGADANTASIVLGYATAIVADANVRIMHEAMGRAAENAGVPISYEPRVWYNPELKSTQFLVPGLIGFILMLTAVVSTALSIAREKERGTMEQLRVAPLGSGHLLLGKTLPYLGISAIATVLILLAARILFGVVIRGPYLDLAIATFVYLVDGLLFGLLISSVSHTQAMAFQAGTVTSMLPAILLSGFVFPIRSMPEVLQYVTYLVPARYYLVILRGIILKGAGLGQYVDQLTLLIIYGVVVFALASILRRRKEV